jgi:hypothetical protein
MMKIEDKINTIGRILADVQLDVNIIRRNQELIKDWLISRDKLKFEKLWRSNNAKQRR